MKKISLKNIKIVLTLLVIVLSVSVDSVINAQNIPQKLSSGKSANYNYSSKLNETLNSTNELLSKIEQLITKTYKESNELKKQLEDSNLNAQQRLNTLNTWVEKQKQIAIIKKNKDEIVNYINLIQENLKSLDASNLKKESNALNRKESEKQNQ